jgi:hypothetical protein
LATALTLGASGNPTAVAARDFAAGGVNGFA